MNIQTKITEPNVNVILEGRRIKLAPITENEIGEEYLSWLNNSDTNKFLETRHRKQTIEDIYEYINSLRLVRGCEIFAVFSIKDNAHIGNLAITRYDQNGDGISIYGVVIGGKGGSVVGVGAEAEALIVEFLFSNPEIRKIKAAGHDINYKSWRLLESLGFKREAVFRQEAVLESGQICDTYHYGLLKEEWVAHRKKIPFVRFINITDNR